MNSEERRKAANSRSMLLMSDGALRSILVTGVRFVVVVANVRLHEGLRLHKPDYCKRHQHRHVHTCTRIACPNSNWFRRTVKPV